MVVILVFGFWVSFYFLMMGSVSLLGSWLLGVGFLFWSYILSYLVNLLGMFGKSVCLIILILVWFLGLSSGDYYSVDVFLFLGMYKFWVLDWSGKGIFVSGLGEVFFVFLFLVLWEWI